MGWGNCGEDSQGRPIGYCHEGICDEPRCKKEIDRGLSYACGGMHGEADFYCEKYFCSKHLIFLCTEKQYVCRDCYKCYLENGGFDEEEE